MFILHIDYETRSTVDLFKQGLYNYACHASTAILCMPWAFDDDEPQLWTPSIPFPAKVLAHFEANAPASTYAHNASFERLITNNVLSKYIEFKQPSISHWYCTAAQARARALPAGLDDLGACLDLDIRKDRIGKTLIKKLCVPTFDPNGGKTFNNDPDLLAQLYSYALQDVRTERLAATMSSPLTEVEHADWCVSEAVNDAGIRIDRPFAVAAAAYAKAEVDEISAALSDLTDGEITTPRQHARIKKLIAPTLAADRELAKLMTVTKVDRRKGVTSSKIVFDQSARTRLLSLEEEQPGRVPGQIIELTELVNEAGRSSVHKFMNMDARASADDRVRGAYIFSGAGQTGRFSSVGLQVHNLPRACADDPRQLRETVLAEKPISNVMTSLASMLRPSIVAAPGSTLVWGDWASVEARILPWLSDSEGGREVLDIFTANDADPSKPDIYMAAAAGLFPGSKPEDITKSQRLVGKVLVLSAGYEGGYRALQAMARAYGLTFTIDDADDTIKTWRSANLWAKTLWRDLERAAWAACRLHNEAFDVGRLTYSYSPASDMLSCTLPSGRALSYPQPRIAVDERGNSELTAIKASWKPKQGETRWGRIKLYGGMLAENVTQATAACLLRHAMKLTVEDGWPLIGTTHDELLMEVYDDEVDEACGALEAVMRDSPAWAEGLPIACTIDHDNYYRK